MIQHKTLKERKETVLQYAQAIFKNGTELDQIQFLSKIRQNGFIEWDFERIERETENINNTATLETLNNIDESIERIKQLNKIIHWNEPKETKEKEEEEENTFTYTKENNFNPSDLMDLLNKNN